MDPRRDLATLAAIVLGVIVLVQGARGAARAAWARRRSRRRMQRAMEGERAAEPLLARAGYRVIGRQVRASIEYAIDGAPCEVEVRADYVVERDGQEWVAEVKTGEHAPRLTTSATRRQLLEYGHAFGAAGVLLVDPERERVHRVSLPRREEASRSPRLLTVFVVGVVVGAAIVCIARVIQP